MATKYLLPCACGKSTPIEAAQAGETIVCACGMSLAAPTMRGLKQLPVVVAPAPARPARLWGPGQGLALLGCFAILAGLGLLAAYYATRPQLDMARISHAVDILHPVETWQVWDMLQHGLPGPPSQQSAQIVQRAPARKHMLLAGCVVAALGVVIVVIGMVYIHSVKPRPIVPRNGGKS